jgi:hypothetical protein
MLSVRFSWFANGFESHSPLGAGHEETLAVRGCKTCTPRRVRDSSPAFPLARPPAGGSVALKAPKPRSAGSSAYWPTMEAPDPAATSGLSEAITVRVCDLR